MKLNKSMDSNKKLFLEIVALLIALPGAYMTIKSCNAPTKKAPNLIRDLTEADKAEVLEDFSEARKLYISMDKSTLADQTIKAKLVLQTKYRQMLEKFCRNLVPITEFGDPEAFAQNIVRCEDSRSKQQLDRACSRAESTILALIARGLEQSDFEKFKADWLVASNPKVGVSDQQVYVKEGLKLIQTEVSDMDPKKEPKSPPDEISIAKLGSQFAFMLVKQSQGQKPVWTPSKNWKFSGEDTYYEQPNIPSKEWRWENTSGGAYVTLATHSRPFESLFRDASRLFLKDKEFEFVNPSETEILDGVLPRSNQSIKKGRVFEYRQFVAKDSIWFRKVMVYRTINGVLYTLLVCYPEDANLSPTGTYRQMRSVLTSANYWD